ncbi:unnamed protein product [Amoebophrya sp. A120]|nr:unnamed protein product [Amoebophrya sp. A120]|eukprot:GSA120T00010108001.1
MVKVDFNVTTSNRMVENEKSGKISQNYDYTHTTRRSTRLSTDSANEDSKNLLGSELSARLVQKIFIGFFSAVPVLYMFTLPWVGLHTLYAKAPPQYNRSNEWFDGVEIDAGAPGITHVEFVPGVTSAAQLPTAHGPSTLVLPEQLRVEDWTNLQMLTLSEMIADAPATGLMSLLFFFPCLFLWFDFLAVSARVRSGKMEHITYTKVYRLLLFSLVLIFQILFGLFLAHPVGIDKAFDMVHYCVVMGFCFFSSFYFVCRLYGEWNWAVAIFAMFGFFAFAVLGYSLFSKTKIKYWFWVAESLGLTAMIWIAPMYFLAGQCTDRSGKEFCMFRCCACCCPRARERVEFARSQYYNVYGAASTKVVDENTNSDQDEDVMLEGEDGASEGDDIFSVSDKI